MKTSLSSIVKELESGARPKGGSKGADLEIPSLGAEHLNSSGGFNFSNLKTIDRSFFKSMNKGIIKPNDILIVKDGATTAKVSFVDKSFPYREASINEHLFRLSVDQNKADPKFVYHYLISPLGKEDILKDYRGSTVGGIGRTFVDKVYFTLPPLKEQKRIAAILDKADELRRKRERSIQLTDDLLRSAFLDMFGDPGPKNWELTTVENIARHEKGSIRTGPFGSQLLHSEFTDTGIAVLGIDNAVQNTFQWAKQRFISESKYRSLKRYTVRPGDLIITIMGTCGRAAIIPDDCPTAINTKHLCCITLNNKVCTPEYVHSYFLLHPISQEYLKKSAKGAIMDGLNMSIIKDLPIYIPPLELQIKYSSFYRRNLSNKQKLYASNLSSKDLFESLSKKLFQGEPR